MPAVADLAQFGTDLLVTAVFESSLTSILIQIYELPYSHSGVGKTAVLFLELGGPVFVPPTSL